MCTSPLSADGRQSEGRRLPDRGDVSPVCGNEISLQQTRAGVIPHPAPSSLCLYQPFLPLFIGSPLKAPPPSLPPSQCLPGSISHFQGVGSGEGAAETKGAAMLATQRVDKVTW